MLEHQNHVQDVWSQDYQAHHLQQQDDSDAEMDRELAEAFTHVTQDRYYTPGGSSSQGGQ
ncbi:hypothetical protein A2U01_0083508 [Trifolium medium]|uniref:Uncharacterized protein n=1 Tax=Trifolium medium TaxID=97028 RepID=A0A392TM59_9FABA|nr:hypothetical protein [Trifolium medium]